jgi:HD-GYP domain-containing protein (c-di-GMP phosphodiesterase class II)
LSEVAEIVHQHRERYDGTGEPEGLNGTEIRLEARVVAVCDAWADLRSARPHEDGLDTEEAVRRLQRGRGTRFDPEVVDAFLLLLSSGRLGEPLRLGAPAPTPSPRLSRARHIAWSGSLRRG